MRPTRAMLATLLLAAVTATAVGACGQEGPEESGESVERERSAEERQGEGDGRAVDEDDAGPTGAPGAILSACRSVVESAPALSDERRREIIAECEAAADGDEETLRKAAGAACDAIAFGTVPAPARGAASAACRRAIP